MRAAIDGPAAHKCFLGSKRMWSEAQARCACGAPVAPPSTTISAAWMLDASRQRLAIPLAQLIEAPAAILLDRLRAKQTRLASPAALDVVHVPYPHVRTMSD